MNSIPKKAQTSTGASGFSHGRNISRPKDGQNAADANPGYLNQAGDGGHNKGRLSPGREIHHNGGQASIRQGTTGTPPR
jgi:hypothetical protein